MPENTTFGPDYDAELDRIVDTQNISYDEARGRIDESKFQPLTPQVDAAQPVALPEPLPAHADTRPIHGPFTEPTSEVLQGVAEAKYLSELRSKKIGPMVAKLANTHKTSEYELKAIRAGVVNRKNTLKAPAEER